MTPRGRVVRGHVLYITPLFDADTSPLRAPIGTARELSRPEDFRPPARILRAFTRRDAVRLDPRREIRAAWPENRQAKSSRTVSFLTSAARRIAPPSPPHS